jgi:DNA-binding protein HU-beta
MTTTEMIKTLATRLQITQREARRHLYNLFATFANGLQNGESIMLRGFGTFGTRESKPRRSYLPFRRNLSAKKFILIPSKIYVFFRPGKRLKEAVKERRPT